MAEKLSIDQLKAELKERVADGNNFCIQALMKVLKKRESQCYDDFIMLRARHKSIQSIPTQSTVDFESLERKSAEISRGLLILIDFVATSLALLGLIDFLDFYRIR
ncbi:MAG: hypothetical protein AAF740_08925, partial [Bacteroidota bacterium]